MITTLTRPKTAKTQVTSSAGTRVFLIGMMGSGKSFWAQKLRTKLKVPAYDLDNLVEIMEEQTIAEMFETHGEEYFRREEAKMLRLFKQKKAFVLSCGGGTPCFNDNMEWMNKHGITIWIDEPVDVLVERLVHEREHRPLIRKLNEHDLADFLTLRLQERKMFYVQAQYHLTGNSLNEKNLLSLIQAHV